MGNVIVAHEDGRTYSTTEAGFRKLYEPQGFKIVGDETPSAFIPAGVPKAKRARKPVRAKAKAKPAAAPKPVLAEPGVPDDVPVIPEPATEP